VDYMPFFSEVCITQLKEKFIYDLKSVIPPYPTYKILQIYCVGTGRIEF